jgi:hypothetical protein
MAEQPMRMNFEFNDALVRNMNALKEKTGAASMKELFNNTLTMLEWTVDEIEKGNEITATGRDGKPHRVFVTPLLRQVKVDQALQEEEQDIYILASVYGFASTTKVQ